METRIEWEGRPGKALTSFRTSTLRARNVMAKLAGTALLRENPWALSEWRPVPCMLLMPAGQFGDPILLCILMKADDLADAGHGGRCPFQEMTVISTR